MSVLVGQWDRVGPQVNKFEQDSSDDHQMSVAGGRPPGRMSRGGVDPRSDVQGKRYPTMWLIP